MPALNHPALSIQRQQSALIALLAIGLAITGATAVHASAASTAEPGAEAAVVEVVYKTVPTRDLKLWLYRPANWRATDRRPSIVLFHGGGWGAGDPANLAHQARHFQTHGFVAILAAYRLAYTDGSFTEDSIYDARSALRWVKSNAAAEGIDAASVVAGGGSAGAHLAMGTAMFAGLDDPSDELTVDPSPVALVAWNPVVDTTRPDGYGSSTFRGDPALGSPIHRITPGLPPVILMHGDADTSVPITRARAFRDAYEAAGNTMVFHEYPGAGHGFFNSEPARSQTLAQIDGFLAGLGLLPVPDQPVPPPLKAAFTVSAAVVAAGEPVDLDASNAEGNIVSYLWDLGDGDVFESGESFHTHQWAAPGPKAVRLTVTDAYDRSHAVTQVIRITGDGEVAGDGWLDTGDWLGWINAKRDPYWWIKDLGNWVYAPPDADGWIFFFSD